MGRDSSKNCLLHEDGTYSTEQCFKILAFVKREKKKNEQKEVKSVDVVNDESKMSEDVLFYSVSNIPARNSSFFLEGHHNGEQITFLIDTGADISMVSDSLNLIVDRDHGNQLQSDQHVVHLSKRKGKQGGTRPL